MATLGSSLIMLLLTGPVQAQTLFETLDTAPDYTRYQHFDECRLAIERVASNAQRVVNVWKDTVKYDPERIVKALPPVAIAVGRTCMEKFNLDTVSAEAATQVATLLLLSGLDDKAQQLFERIYRSVPVNDKPIQLAKMMAAYGHGRPLRLEPMKRLYTRAKADWDTMPAIVVETGALLGLAAYTLHDTATYRPVAEEVFDYNQKLSFEDKMVDTRQLGNMRNHQRTTKVFDLYRNLNTKVRLASMVDEKTYQQYRVKEFMRLYGDSSKIQYFLGQQTRHIDPLTAHFLYRSVPKREQHGSDSSLNAYKRIPTEQWTPIPIPGRVNVVAFIQGGCHSVQPGQRPNGTPVNCAFLASALRRLKRTHPEVDITVVTRTYGSLGPSAPLTPEEEADTLAKLFLGYFRIPGMLMVETTEFFRVPGNDLDQRRIDKPTANEERSKGVNYHGALLAVDQDGKMFRFDRMLVGKEELELEQEVGAILKRRKSP